MKNTIILVALITLGFQVGAAAPQKTKRMTTCERLQKQAEENCTESMCEEATGDSQNTECIKDGDFYEGMQICVSESELPDLIAAYNKKHPGKNLTCEE